MNKALALAARGDYPSALRALCPRAARQAPKALADFYTFVGEDDLLSHNPLACPLSKGAWRVLRQALSSLPREGAAAAALRGWALLCAGRWAESTRVLCAAAARSPHDGRLATLAAAALWARGDRERTKRWVLEAWRLVERAVALGERSREALLLRAQVRAECDDHAGSLRDLEEILRRHPEDDLTRVGRLDKLLDAGRYAAAAREVALLLRRHPRAWWVHAQRGRLEGLRGRPAAALADFERARRLNPGSGAVLVWKAEALRRLGRLAEAEAALNEAARLDPSYSLLWEQRGRLKLVLDRPREALADLSRACRVDGVRALARAWRGEANLKLGRFAAAWDDFERVSPLEPRTTWIVPGAARPTPEARERRFWDDLDAAVARAASPWALLLRGRFCAAMGRLRQALADLTAAASHPAAARRTRAEALCWRGLAALRLGAARRALCDIDQSLVLLPAMPRVRLWRAEALFALGREDEARRELDLALRRPARPLANGYLRRAALREAQGDGAGARRDYETAFVLDASNARARAALARLRPARP